ncbi:hypothetical protein B0H14DRAFT_2627722 [Mycena olivaceomarginata]|nr:hypothetical protein B0H14DRAFT_2627722 [Mycena olivaceomarginata]
MSEAFKFWVALLGIRECNCRPIMLNPSCKSVSYGDNPRSAGGNVLVRVFGLSRSHDMLLLAGGVAGDKFRAIEMDTRGMGWVLQHPLLLKSQDLYPGSSVTVFGTVAAKNPPQASLRFVVDNSITGTYTTPTLASNIHHEALWTLPTMHEGLHTIVITQTAAQSAGVIFPDYIMYNTISSTVHPYFIDDHDLRIKYSITWKKFGSESDFQHTSEGSTFAGDSFSLQFKGKCIRKI